MEPSNQNTNIEVEIKYIRRDLDEIKKTLGNKFVTKTEFTPVKNLVYGMVGLILTTVLVALVGLIIIPSI